MISKAIAMNELNEEVEKAPANFVISQASETLSENVRKALKNYFNQLKGEEPRGVYQMILSEVEVPLLEIIMKHAKDNQARAAILLGLSRGNVRKKLKVYGMLYNCK